MSDPTAEHLWTLVARIQAGERAALDEFYTLVHPHLSRFVRSRVAGKETSEDVVGDVWLRICRKIDTVQRGSESPLAWVVTIATNVMRDHWKSAHARLSTPTAVFPELPSPDNGPEQHVLSRDDRLRLRALLRTLRPEQRACMEFRYLLGWSVAETARAMGRSEGAVTALAQRAISNLYKTMYPGQPRPCRIPPMRQGT